MTVVGRVSCTEPLIAAHNCLACRRSRCAWCSPNLGNQAELAKGKAAGTQRGEVARAVACLQCRPWRSWLYFLQRLAVGGEE